MSGREAALAALLTTRTLGRSLQYFDELDSTNRYLKDTGVSLPHGAVCFTAMQSAGRGRLGRSWTAPAGETLAMSVLLKGADGAPQLPLLCGLAAAGALGELAGSGFGIKWPNDIICKGRKVCGILCESRPAPDGRFLVAGIGVNLAQGDEWFRRAELPHAGSVKGLTGVTLSLEETAAAVLNRLEPLWERYEREGFAPFAAAYAARCVHVGKKLRVLAPDGTIRLEGEGAGVDEDGNLLVLSGGKIVPVAAGEVSLRGAEGYI